MKFLGDPPAGFDIEFIEQYCFNVCLYFLWNLGIHNDDQSWLQISMSYSLNLQSWY